MIDLDREQLRRDCSDALDAIQQEQDVPGLQDFPARLRALEPTYLDHAVAAGRDPAARHARDPVALGADCRVVGARSPVMARELLCGLLLVAGLVGCAPTGPGTETETQPAKEEDLDRAECRRQTGAVVGPRPPGGGGPAGVLARQNWESQRRQVFEECMKTKGY